MEICEWSWRRWPYHLPYRQRKIHEKIQGRNKESKNSMWTHVAVETRSKNGVIWDFWVPVRKFQDAKTIEWFLDHSFEPLLEVKDENMFISDYPLQLVSVICLMCLNRKACFCHMWLPCHVWLLCQVHLVLVIVH